MVDKRYGIPFVAALVLNLVYWGVVGDWFGHIKPPETPKKDLVINLDMGQQEPPQEKKDPEKLKIQPDDKPVAGGGEAVSHYPLSKDSDFLSLLWAFPINQATHYLLYRPLRRVCRQVES